MYIPRGFLRGLKTVDLDYKVFIDEESGIYDITKDEKRVDCFTILNDATLTELRHRKWIGKRIYTGYETARERAIKNQRWIKKEKQRVAEKKRRLAVDMKTKTWMRIWRHEHTKMFT